MISWQHLTWVTQMYPFVLMTWTSFSGGTAGPFHVLHTLCTLCCASLCILSDGPGCFVWSCWQMPGICHTHLPSYNVPPRGGWQWFWYFHLAYSTRGRMTSTPCQQKCLGTWGHHPNKVPAGQPWHGSCPSHTASKSVHGTALVTAPRSSFSLGPQSHALKDRCFSCW